MDTRFRRDCFSISLSVVLLLAASCGHAAQTTRVSVDSAGIAGDASSDDPSISADGRFVAFSSQASNLVPGDTNAIQDIFIHDRHMGTTTRLSLDSASGEADGASGEPSASADGRFVAFNSEAANLVLNDTNAFVDVFVRDLSAGVTTRVSVNSMGGEGNSDSRRPSISADGRFVAFWSTASNLVLGDANDFPDVFIHDRSDGITTRLSVSSAGGEGNDESRDPSISADGRYVAFTSAASTLVPADVNGVADIFVHDRNTGTTTRVSVDSTGSEGNNTSSAPAISADGRYVAFSGDASNLVLGDTNGLSDVFVHDRSTAITTRVSVDSAGGEGNDASGDPQISADGRHVTFYSPASNLVPGDTAGFWDLFIHDRQAATTNRVSVSTGAGQANNNSFRRGSLNADGRHVAFGSRASNLVSGDVNRLYDAFVRDRLLNKGIETDLEIVATSAPASVVKTTYASYTFTVTNNGLVGAGYVTLIDISSRAPASLTPSQGFCSKKSEVSVCQLGTMAPGASATVAVVIKATSMIPLTQQVSVSAAPVESDPTDNSVTLSTPVTP